MQGDQLTGNEFVRKRALVVDDFDGMRSILRDLLRKVGTQNVDTAANGSEALAALAHNRYDIVLCDYHLGPGKNGQQVLEEARAQGLVDIATIWCMVTAEKTSEMVLGAAEHQPDDYLIKPLTEAILQVRLAKLVRRKAVLSVIQAAIRAKEYLKAIALCDRQLAEDKAGNADIARLRCDLLIQTGKYDEARAAYEKQLAVRDTTWAKAGLAKLHFREGKFDQARDLLQDLVDNNRAYLEGYDWLAKTHVQLGNWQKAQAVLARAAALSPNSISRQQALGEVALQCDDLDAAEHAFKKSVTLGTNSSLKTPQPYLGLSKIYSQHGNQADALAVLGKLTKDIEGETVQLQAKAAEIRVFQATGDEAQARQSARELSTQVQKGSQDLPPSIALDVAEALMESGDKETGSQLIQFVARNNHEDESLIKRAKEIFEQADMGDAGIEVLESSRRLAIEAMDKGVRLASQGNLEEGIVVLREACALMPNNARVLLNHAYLLISFMEKHGWQEKLWNEARDCIDTARKHSTDDKRCGQLSAKLETIRQP